MKPSADPSLDDFERLARAAYAALPAEFRNLTHGIVFMVQDFPDDETARDLVLRSKFDLLGLYRGATLAGEESGAAIGGQNMIFLFRRPILDFWRAQGGALADIVRHVLVHEIGHHFGLSDEDMEAIENSGP